MDRTLCVRLQYDGTRFLGWQRQAVGRTVQGELEAVLERLCSRPVQAIAAGRTDAGVHALGMAVSATVPARWTPDALRKALNALLPDDCRAVDVRAVRTGFHARYSATGRSYEYRIGTDQGAMSPFRRPFEWGLDRPLDLGSLARQATALLGTHDFRWLAVHTGERSNCRCTVRSAAWVERRDDRGFAFRIAADRFLHHMVRILVGTMVAAATGQRDATDLTDLLSETPTRRASPPAPARGLYFVHAEYPEHWFRLEENTA